MAEQEEETLLIKKNDFYGIDINENWILLDYKSKPSQRKSGEAFYFLLQIQA